MLSGKPRSGYWNTIEGAVMSQIYEAKSREDLCHGDKSDFELANRIFMAGRNDIDLIEWQTAAKERIRWLSVKLAEAEQRVGIGLINTEGAE